MYILDFRYTLIQTTVGAHQRWKPQEVSSLKGSARVNKASLTQYVNGSISEVNHGGVGGTQNGNRRARDWSHEEDRSLATLKSSIFVVQWFLNTVPND